MAEQPEDLADEPPRTPGPRVDAFILFNEREEVVPQLVDELTGRGISTHFWRRDIAPGDEWKDFEDERLRTAKTVVVFLGSSGWGPNHQRLAAQAQTWKKRIVPVLIGDPPSEAFQQLDGMFERLRYVDLRRRDAARKHVSTFA